MEACEKMKRIAHLGRGAMVVALLFGAYTASATMVDLTTPGASGVIGGAIFEQITPQGTGTGMIESFARIGAANQNEVQGYNTTVDNVFDNGSTANYNRSITVGDAPIMAIDSITYYQFLLDINEAGGQNTYLSLDEVQIFVGGTPNPSSTMFDGAGILQGVGTLVYDMEAGLENWVALDYSLNRGSGSGDMFLYVPVSYFGGASEDSIVTLYSHFGRQGLNPEEFGAGNFGNSDGFEEWAVLTQETTVVPEPATMSLLGLGLAGLLVRRFARKN